MHSDVLAKDVVVADAQARRFAFELEVLRRLANDAPRKEMVVRADGGLSGQIDVGSDHAVRPCFHTLINHSTRPDANGGVELCFWMYDGGRMNHLVVCIVAADVSRLKLLDDA